MKNKNKKRCAHFGVGVALFLREAAAEDDGSAVVRRLYLQPSTTTTTTRDGRTDKGQAIGEREFNFWTTTREVGLKVVISVSPRNG